MDAELQISLRVGIIPFGILRVIEQSTRRRKYAKHHIAGQSKESIEVLLKNKTDILGCVEADTKWAGAGL
jgi:hypothetical protein